MTGLIGKLGKTIFGEHGGMRTNATDDMLHRLRLSDFLNIVAYDDEKDTTKTVIKP